MVNESSSEFPRPLTGQEAEVVEAMVLNGTSSHAQPTQADRERWLTQIPNLVVTGRCDCGTCYSINFFEEQTDGADFVLDGFSPRDEMVMLLVDGDRLSSLEIPPLADDLPTTLPRASELSFPEWEPVD
ncbi:hypothetical protein J2S49_001746 [Arcanobacterium wilhelmae]|uniref:Uncharacterized protein n=1 Tax=Arcanobacterium wilhelmae TaxID=1803177 RepID=A0ABT9ND71_9ACTO|nr:hypothetical protein [Arcanobacterium wilhelmae]MDP9801670.1 hypothetical protein [Arcanobacterium wilhelmae]WFN90991.1 hypothetical protein P8A24_03830 [Arcanobacterium wilhelmae]